MLVTHWLLLIFQIYFSLSCSWTRDWTLQVLPLCQLVQCLACPQKVMRGAGKGSARPDRQSSVLSCFWWTGHSCSYYAAACAAGRTPSSAPPPASWLAPSPTGPPAPSRPHPFWPAAPPNEGLQHPGGCSHTHSNREGGVSAWGLLSLFPLGFFSLSHRVAALYSC